MNAVKNNPSNKPGKIARILNIDGFEISDNSDCYVIAEIGANHQGDVEKCKALFESAAQCGANAVKLQKRSNKSLYTQAMFNEPYSSENAYAPTYGEHRNFLEFGTSEYTELISVARELDVTFFSTAFDFESADFLAKLNMPAYKIASADLRNIPLIKHVATFGKPMVISTGGGTLEDVQRAHDALESINPQFSFLQCTASYSCDFKKLNLRVIETFRSTFPKTVIGLSSHDNGYTMALMAYMLGARIVEKHFTLNRALKGTDHAFSLEASGLRRLVRDLRRGRLAMGDGVKERYDAEIPPLLKMEKSLVASRNLPAGHLLTAEDIAIRSPGGGTPPFEFDRFVGRTTRIALETDALITNQTVK